MKEKQKILLTGASGTVGSQILKQLLEKDCYEVAVFDVDSFKTKKKFKKYEDKIEIIYGDIRDKKSIAKACKNKNVILHLAAIIPPLADKNPDLAYAVNVIGSQNILETMEKDAFFVYASSVSVYGDRVENPMIKVTDPLSPSLGDTYAKTKIATEEYIRASSRKWTIFRLSAIMGYGNHKISGFMFHMPLATALEITTPEDTARAFVHAIEYEKQLVYQTFNLGGGECCRTNYESFLQQNFEAYGLGKLNFPEKSFAEKNFHCGYYADGDDLEKKIHFRKDNLETYFFKLRASIPPFQRFFTNVFKRLVKYYLLKKSEPYHAYKTCNKALMNIYFKKTEK